MSRPGLLAAAAWSEDGLWSEDDPPTLPHTWPAHPLTNDSYSPPSPPHKQKQQSTSLPLQNTGMPYQIPLAHKNPNQTHALIEIAIYCLCRTFYPNLTLKYYLIFPISLYLALYIASNRSNYY